MVFASPIFLFAFMPLAVSLCMLARWTRRPRVRNGLLLFFSLLFYAWGEPTYVLLMLGAILVNYLLALRVQRSRLVFICAVVLDLGMLAVFKYLDLIIGAVNGLFRLGLPGAHLALPIGISFYTFQILSYVIDVRRGDVPPARDLVDFATYVSMFPQLIAGPIVRYADVAADLGRLDGDSHTAAEGARRFCVGLAKKVLLANTLATAADNAFGMTGLLSFGGAWVGLIAYALQIYFDFSGYSDMAIGLGRMLGFSFPENFRYPYVSLSVKEFWRRWHISLSTWFRDYLYIPLGGSRRGKGRTLLNLLIIFSLCGLWHGADGTFLLWGLWHGLFLCLERLKGMQRLQAALPKGVRWCYTALVVLLGWVLFRADSVQLALQYVQDLFSLEGMWMTEVLTAPSAVALLVGAVCALPLPRPRANGLTETLYTLAALALLAVCALCLAGGTYNPFIYFRF